MNYAENLGKRLKLARLAHKVTMRHWEKDKELKISSSTISRIEQGKPVDYETGKKIEYWLSQVGEPEMCQHCNGHGFKLVRK